mgnify:CR=1 FL=1
MDAKWTPDADDTSMGTVEVVIRTNSQPITGMRKRRALSILLDRSGSMGDTDMKSGIRVAVDAIDALDLICARPHASGSPRQGNEVGQDLQAKV